MAELKVRLHDPIDEEELKAAIKDFKKLGITLETESELNWAKNPFYYLTIKGKDTVSQKKPTSKKNVLDDMSEKELISWLKAHTVKECATAWGVAESTASKRRRKILKNV